MLENAVVPRASIDEIVGLRSQSLDLFQQGYAMIRQARDIASRASPKGYLPTFPDNIKYLLENCSEKNEPAFQAGVTKMVDQAIWDHLISVTGIERLMDAQARNQFRHQLREDPPEVSVENCLATVEGLMLDARTIFLRGIANVFARLDRRFRTHDAYTIGSKIIFNAAFTDYGCWSSRRCDEYLRDVERTFHVIDGREQPERYAGIIGAIDEQRTGFGCKTWEAESEFFRAKGFKNGNLHIWFKRDELVVEVNKLLAEYYGAALADGSDETRTQPKTSAHMTPAKNFGFFPTPDDLADDIISDAYIRDGDRVLEPNAGTGALSRRALESGGRVTCIEVQPHLALQLEQDDRYEAVINMDFLAISPELTQFFDRVVMNPPFDRGRDIDHVSHAIEFLAPGGLLIAIMSAGTEFRSDSKATAFRTKIERYGGRFHDLPAGSFAEAGTMVNTVVLTLRKPSS